MNENPHESPATPQNRGQHLDPNGCATEVSCAEAPPSRKSGLKVGQILGYLLCFAVLAVITYSIYVAAHEPDLQETVVLGQTRLASSSPAALRILVRNRVSGKPIQDAEVALSLSSKLAGKIKLGTFRTDAMGSLGDTINIPAMAPGDCDLVIDARSREGRDHVVSKVTVQSPTRVLLSSDKPIYQPGQTIHLRSIVLNGRTQQPMAGEPVTFEVSDAKGNKVFKKSCPASGYGIAATDFVLATELNLGRYELRAAAGGISTERTVEVKRYVLPKFKIRIDTDRSYYLPGQKVSGSVEAKYFFGKPVRGGEVKLTGATIVEKAQTIAELKGITDADGRYSFQFVLPDFMVGMPQKNQEAFLDITAEVLDTAQHAETTTLSLSVARTELQVAAFPEAGVLVPGMENVLYVMTAYPDGRPAKCTVSVNGAAYPGDKQGVSAIKFVPESAHQLLAITAVDAAGRRAGSIFQVESNRVVPPLLIRTDRAVYQAGKTAQIKLLSPEKGQTVFLDVIKDNQTVLTKSVSLKGQQADYALPLPPALVGVLRINAYLITSKGEDCGYSRLIYVDPASSLQVKASLDKSVYRPGEVAKMNLQVTDVQGQPAPAALGIAAVDESVFAVHENRPGLLRQFLEAEGELLKPRYQIKFFASPERLLNAQNDLLAQAYFSSIQLPIETSKLEQAIAAGYVEPRMLERIRSLRGTKDYESLRRDPYYAEMIRLVETENGTGRIREITGPAKVFASEARRQAYFRKVEWCFNVGPFGLFFVLPLWLLMKYSLQAFRIPHSASSPSPETTRYAQVAGSIYNQLGVLTLSPLVIYPIGFILLNALPGLDGMTVVYLLGFEIAVLGFTIMLQFGRIERASAEGLETEMATIRCGVTAFLLQFFITRGGIALAMISGWGFSGLLCFGATILVPLALMGGLKLHIRRQLASKGAPLAMMEETLRISPWEIVAVIAVLCVLASLLLPALAKAKDKSSRVSLASDLKQIDLASRMMEADGITTQPGGSATTPPRVRRHFPETLYWNPEVITDDRGQASVEIGLADSITTWRGAIEGVSAAGKMGSTEMPIPVFQDFFVDLDLPVAMSLGDEVSVPIACYNYLRDPQDVRLTIEGANWFTSPVQNTTVHLGPNEVKSIQVPIKVMRVGQHALRVVASGTKLADAIEREIRVVPTGQAVEYTLNEALRSAWTDVFTLPSGAISDSQSLWLKFYPSRFSEIVEGLESIFRAPYGCFEQTSSTTYPNVLALDYLKRLGKLTPEIEITARKYINAGYQRLLTFEVAGGGFEWFGHPPANVCLTAYGILEFTDMARVHTVDPALIARTRKWLFTQQHGDGSWGEIHRGWTWAGRGSMTAFVAWALAESGDRSHELDKALNYLRSHPGELDTVYARALAANAFLARDPQDSFGRDLATQLKEGAVVDGPEMLHWTSQGQSMTYSHGAGLDVETTALAAAALMKAGLWPQTAKQALTWISRQKGPDGTWGSTQATILAMRALLSGSNASLGQEFTSKVTVSLNGKDVETFEVNKENSDVMKAIELTRHIRTGENRVELRQTPAGELPFQLAGVYWVPSRSPEMREVKNRIEPLEISLQYDRTTLPVNGQLICTVTVKNNTRQLISMAMVDLGIPPGFVVDAGAFAEMQEKGQIAKYEITGNQAILYLRELSQKQPLVFRYPLTAQYPLRVQTPPSAVYEYYQPKNRAESKGTMLQAVGD